MGKKQVNGEGNVRLLPDGKYECIIQSKYLNPKTGKAKRIKRKANTEKEARNNAKAVLTAWEKEIEKGRDTKFSKTTTFGEYMENFIEDEVKPNITGSAYHSYIKNMNRNFFDFPISKFQLHMLNSVEFERYFNDILSKKSKKTCALPMQLSKRCCKWLVQKSLLKENYAEQARIKKEVIDEYDLKREEELKKTKKVFSSEDIEKFYYAYKNNMGQYPVVVLFLLETGMRLSEFAALRNSNVDLDNNKIYIVESRSIRFKDNDKNKGIEYYVKVPKNRESRFIIMSDLCRECVLYMMEQTKLKCPNNPDDLLYPSFNTGKRRSNSSMEVCFKGLCNKLNIDRDVHLTRTGQKKGLCLHSLRHTADSIANTSKGANVVNTAFMMGHKSIKAENIYTHATDEGLKSITTASQAILKDYKKDSKKNDNEEELFEMYLKLKDKFENTKI